MSEEPKITINPQTGLVKVQGVPVCQRLRTPNGIVLTIQPKCKNSRKSRALAGKPARVTLQEFVKAVSE